MQTLIPGQRQNLSQLQLGLQLHITLSQPAEALPLCLLLNDQQQLLDAQHLIGLKHTASPCQTLSQNPQPPQGVHYFINLENAPPQLHRLVFVLLLQPSGNAPLPAHASAVINHLQLDWHGEHHPFAQMQFTGAQFEKNTALILADIYRKDGWRLMANGSGFIDGPHALNRHYGVPLAALRPANAPPSGELPSLPAAASGPAAAGGPQPDAFTPLRLPSDWPGRTPAAIPAGLAPAVGLLVGYSPFEGTFSSTAFAITPGGHLLTCEHSVRGATELGFRAEGSPHTRPIRVLACDPEADLALLWLTDGLGSCDWLRLAPQGHTPALGDEVGLLSYPLGVTLGDSITYTQGIINSLRDWDGHRVLQADSGSAQVHPAPPCFAGARAGCWECIKAA